MNTTQIEWCDATLNLWWGCTKVSEGCKHCYAEDISDNRFGGNAWGPKGVRKEIKSWRKTLAQVSNRAKAENRRLKVFCSSMSDVFEGPETMGGLDSDNWVLVSRLQDELLGEVFSHPELDFLFLTKRPQNILDVVHRHDGHDTQGYNWDFPHNAWFGTSVEDQKTAEKRIPHLLDVPAAVRFLSVEPMLGEVNLCGVASKSFGFDGIITDALRGAGIYSSQYSAYEECDTPGPIHWVIVGGESGRNARPMHPDWVRSVRDQCVDAKVPFFFKQWGGWAPYGDSTGSGVMVYDQMGCWNGLKFHIGVGESGYQHMQFVGKHGVRLLDGREWNEFPEMNQ